MKAAFVGAAGEVVFFKKTSSGRAQNDSDPAGAALQRSAVIWLSSQEFPVRNGRAAHLICTMLT